MALDIDAVLKKIGEFGRCQQRLYLLLCLPVMFVGAGNMSYAFIAASPECRCVVPRCDANYSNAEYDAPFRNFTIPYDGSTGQWDQCHRYERLNASTTTCEPQDYSPSNTTTCPEGKVFSTAVYHTTIITEFNLTCEDAWRAEMTQTIYFAGVLVGAFAFGWMADMCGRKLTLLVSVVGMAAAGVVAALVPSLVCFSVARFFNAVATTGLFQTAFVLGMEYVGPEWRVMCGVVVEYFYAAGEVLLGLTAWWLKKWRMTQLLISAPVLCFIFYWWPVLESPRWLLTRGRLDDTLKVLDKIAKGNGEIMPEDVLRRDSMSEQEPPTTTAAADVTMKDIVKAPLLCVRMLCMFYIWVVVTLVFYGLSLNSTSLSKSDSNSAPYVDFILAALVEIPGYTLAWLGMRWWGRRGSLGLSLVLAGLSCAAAGLCAKYAEGYVLVTVLLGKCFITCSFGIIYVFASEMFPTAVRSTVLGLCSTWARVGAMLAPFSNELAKIYGPLPLLLFGGLAAVAGVLNVVMPETLGTNLPSTVNQALQLGKSVSEPDEQQHLLSDSSEDDP